MAAHAQLLHTHRSSFTCPFSRAGSQLADACTLFPPLSDAIIFLPFGNWPKKQKTRCAKKIAESTATWWRSLFFLGGTLCRGSLFCHCIRTVQMANGNGPEQRFTISMTITGPAEAKGRKGHQSSRL